MKNWPSEKAKSIVSFKTGKLDSNAAEPDGKYPFFTCAQETYRINKYAFDTECVLLAGNNAAGIFPLKYYKGKFNAYQRTYIIEPIDRKEVNTRYIYESFKLFLKSFEQTSTGATTKFLTMGILNNLWISKPHISIQRKIAAVLSAYDDLIENNNRRIAILEKMAEELYREWFVRLRFPGYDSVGAGFKPAPTKGVPEGWEVKRIGDILSFKYGYTESAIEDNQYPKFLRVMDINKTSYIKWSEVPNCKIDENEKEKYLLKKSDLVIARMASPGKIAIIERDINAVFASYLIKMTLDTNNILPYYAFYTLTNDYYQGLFSNADTSATRGNINGQIISRFQIIIPPLKLQKLFEKQILSVRNTLNNFVIQNETLTIIRDRLLTRLMSGKIDVEHLDIQIPDSMKEDAAANA